MSRIKNRIKKYLMRKFNLIENIDLSPLLQNTKTYSLPNSKKLEARITVPKNKSDYLSLEDIKKLFKDKFTEAIPEVISIEKKEDMFNAYTTEYRATLEVVVR